MVFETLVDAVKHMDATDKRRVYEVRQVGPMNNGVSTAFVIAVSPSAAAMEFLGEDNVQLVSQKDRAIATSQALRDLLAERAVTT